MKEKNTLVRFIKESLLFEARLSDGDDYIRRISSEVNAINNKYIFEENCLDEIAEYVKNKCVGKSPQIRVKDVSSGQIINVNDLEDSLFKRYQFLYSEFNLDAFGISGSYVQEKYYCKLGGMLFLALNQSGIKKVSFFDSGAKEKEMYDKFIIDYVDEGPGLDPFVKTEMGVEEENYIEFIRKLLVRMSLLAKVMLKKSLSSGEDLNRFNIRFGTIDRARIKRETDEYDLEFASNKMLRLGNRDIVLVRTKSYGNVAFYRRSGTGTGNNLFQGNNLKWLPFGGFCTELSNIDRTDMDGNYTAEGLNWLCKLPRSHPEGDGTGKFLKLYGEFFYIALKLTQDADNLGLTKVSSDILVQKFFGKSMNELENLRNNNSFSFNLSSEKEELYAAIAINQGLFKKGALKKDWLPASQYAFTGSKVWGKNIGHNAKTFRETIRNI